MGLQDSFLEIYIKLKLLERSTIEGDSPVGANCRGRKSILSRAGPEKSCLNQPVPSGKAKYSLVTDSEPVP